MVFNLYYQLEDKSSTVIFCRSFIWRGGSSFELFDNLNNACYYNAMEVLKVEKVRKNLTMSSDLAEWYEEKSLKLGVSQSAMMVMALADYVKQEQAITMMSNFEYVTEQLELLKKQTIK
jgi:hypothetical protein